MRRLLSALDLHDAQIVLGLLLIGGGLALVDAAAALVAVGVLLFFMAVPAARLIRRGDG